MCPVWLFVVSQATRTAQGLPYLQERKVARRDAPAEKPLRGRRGVRRHGGRSHKRGAVVLHSRNHGAYSPEDDLYSKTEIGEAVTNIQEVLSLTDEELAQKLKIAVGTLWKMKSGTVQYPKAFMRLVRLARATLPRGEEAQR